MFFFYHAKELNKTLHHPVECTSNVTKASYSVCFIIQGPLGTARYLELIDTPVWLRGSVRWSYVKGIF